MPLSLSDLKAQVVTPALTVLGLNSMSGVNLVTGTALQESACVWLVQQGGGPALGLFQMEPATELDIWTNFLAYETDLIAAVRSLLAPGPTTQQLVWNLGYAAAMCRIKYWRAPSRLPAYNDAAGLAGYWKDNYNTAAGAGAVDAATIANFQAAIDA